VDFLVTYAPDKRREAWGYFPEQDEMEQLLGRKVDWITRKSVEQGRNPLFRREVLGTAKVIYSGKQIDCLRLFLFRLITMAQIRKVEHSKNSPGHDSSDSVQGTGKSRVNCRTCQQIKQNSTNATESVKPPTTTPILPKSDSCDHTQNQQRHSKTEEQSICNRKRGFLFVPQILLKQGRERTETGILQNKTKQRQRDLQEDKSPQDQPLRRLYR